MRQPTFIPDSVFEAPPAYGTLEKYARDIAYKTIADNRYDSAPELAFKIGRALHEFAPIKDDIWYGLVEIMKNHRRRVESLPGHIARHNLIEAAKEVSNAFLTYRPELNEACMKLSAAVAVLQALEEEDVDDNNPED